MALRRHRTVDAQGQGFAVDSTPPVANAERGITGTLSSTTGEYLLDLSLLDPRAGKLIARVGRRRKAGSSEQLLDEIRPAVFELVSQDPALKGKKLNYERGFGGIRVGLRGDADLLSPGAVLPTITVELSGKHFGGAIGVLGRASPGVRLEGRYYPFVLGRVRPLLAVGSTAFDSGIAARGAGRGGEVLEAAAVRRCGLRAVLVDARAGPQGGAVLVGLGTGWLF